MKIILDKMSLMEIMEAFEKLTDRQFVLRMLSESLTTDQHNELKEIEIIIPMMKDYAKKRQQQAHMRAQFAHEDSQKA